MRQVFFFVVLLIVMFLASFSQAEDSPAELITIPLSSVFTTGPQKGMKHISDRASKSAHHLRKILQTAKSGGSNLFLVDATNLDDAVRASFGALVGSRLTDKPVPVDTPGPVRGNHWLVAYLGSGPSEPVYWEVEGVTVHQNKIRLTYRKPPPWPASRDLIPYYFWIPVGTLVSGSYELELYDAQDRAVMLMRRVTVEKEVEKDVQKETVK